MTAGAVAASARARTAEAIDASRTPELDGIRAIAIVLVLIIHVALQGGAAQAGAALSGFPHVLYLAVSHMWLGVDLFFVLSGFLITGILLDTRLRPTYFRDFYIRRALRIVPLVALVLLAMIVLEPGYTGWYAFGALFLADVAPLAHFATPPAAPPLWSLAVEEQFYFLWPVIVLVLGARRLAVLAALIVIAEPFVRYATTGSLLEVPWLRSDGLAMGALCAIWIRLPAQQRRAPQLLAAIAALVGLLGAAELVFRTAALSGALRLTEANLIFGAAIVVAVVWHGAPWLAVLRSPVSRFIADTSFCAYLIHVPLIGWFDRSGLTSAATPFAAAALRALWVLPATFVLAGISRHFFELPILRLKRVLAP